ncbi:GntR family transcriptional regulator [Streptomyces sp. T028]|uniref:GntR family transcriptional regulator n=1 Tax=Streptomyces sp. T028 TaxID=3394379 RepID=UPI003A893A15
MTKTSREPYVRALEPTSMVDQVAKEIRRSILAGDLRPGQPFSLREIADQLGVSFIPVREALRQLEAQGLVITRPGKSALVAPLHQDDLNGIYRLRRSIEPELAARSCSLLRGSDFQRLQAFVSMCGDEDLGVDEIYEAHHAFHRELLQPAATAWDLRVLESLWHAAGRYIRLAFSGLDSRPEEHRRRKHSHAALLAVFREGDPDAVTRAVLRHLDEHREIAQQMLR